jgi:hypothetical protein
MKLQKIMFISIQGKKSDPYCYADELPVNCIEDDGPTVVGTYKLVGKRTLLKGMIEAKRNKSK